MSFNFYEISYLDVIPLYSYFKTEKRVYDVYSDINIVSGCQLMFNFKLPSEQVAQRKVLTMQSDFA